MTFTTSEVKKNIKKYLYINLLPQPEEKDFLEPCSGWRHYLGSFWRQKEARSGLKCKKNEKKSTDRLDF